MSDNTMPEILWAQYNRDDDTSVQYNAWSTRNEKFVETEYIRADIAQAQIDAANARIAQLEAAQRKAHELKYYIGNPPAWQNYDESVSEAIREAVNITGKAQ